MTFPTYKPRLGVVGMAYPGFQLGEELGPAKLEEMLALLTAEGFDVSARAAIREQRVGAREAGRQLAGQDVDGIVVVVTTFVPDYYFVELLGQCDVPVFLWAVERKCVVFR